MTTGEDHRSGTLTLGVAQRATKRCPHADWEADLLQEAHA